MKTTMTLSANLNCSPFDVFEQDVDEVIMIISFYIALGENDEHKTHEKTTHVKPVAKKNERIRVNDATATGGWF